MDLANNTTVNILDKDNWSSSLLIKDEKGNLTYLKNKIPQIKLGLKSQIDAVSEGDLAPKDASFISMPNISGSSQDKAELIFHPHDKEELDFFAKNVPLDDSKKYSIEKIVARIIEKQKLDFDEKNVKLFTNILYNFFRSRKSAAIVRELLSKNVSLKNKPLSGENLDTILSVIKVIKNKIDLSGGLVVNQAELALKQETNTKPEIPTIKIEETDVSPKSAQDEIKDVLKGALPKVLEEEAKIPPAPKIIEKTIEEKSKTNDKNGVQPAAGFSIPTGLKELDKKPTVSSPKTTIVDNNKISEIKLDSPEEKIDISLPKVFRPGISQTPKRSMSDVLTPVKEDSSFLSKTTLTGPVQELQSFDLIAFRRLGNTAEERVQKVFDRINLLEQDSYTKKAQGIAAWRESGVYKLYLKLGADSMTFGRQVADYIAEKENKNEDTLSVAEFSAISDLNKQLRF